VTDAIVANLPKSARIVLTGAAGLVGQNLLVELREQGYSNLVAIDKHAHNLGILRQLNPGVTAIEADLAEPGAWADAFAGADVVVQLHAQITGKHRELFDRNNLVATGHVLEACKAHRVPFLVHVSSSVVNSVATDDYTETKKQQEAMVVASGLRYCVLRPTLMFGWFDPKHLGWLSRFMARTPVFPIPGDGRFTADQLKALSAGDDFKGVDTEAVFGVKQHAFEDAVRESYCDPRYSHVILKR